MPFFYIVPVVLAIVLGPFLVLGAANRFSRWRRKRVGVVGAMLACVAGCGNAATVGDGNGSGGHTTTTTSTSGTTSSTLTPVTNPCSGLGACIAGSYDVCDLGSVMSGPCCNGSTVSNECVTPAGVLLHSADCDAICLGPSASCALSPNGALTCCSPGGAACQKAVP